MLKKLALLCCAMLITFGAGINIYAEETPSITKEQEFLVAFDIIALNSYGEIDNDQEVTRAEFADICGKLLNINPSITADKAYFTDVTPDKWYAYTINVLAEQGIIAQSENRLFEPDRTITLNEAVKMLTCIMGYGDYAANNGGYPNGYISVAASQNILDGVSDKSGKLTKEMMSKLVYNALHANVMKKNFDGYKTSYVIDENETLMSYYMNLYDDKGIVETVYGMSIKDTDVSDDQIIIDGINYYIGEIENAADYLGYKLKFYYREEDDNSRTLVYIEPFKMAEFMIKSEDIEKFDGLGDKLTYFEGDRRKTVKIASDATVIRNGAIVKENIDEAFNIKNGEMKLVDGDNNGSYETIIIYDYETLVVNTFNQEKGLLTDAIDNQLIIDISNCDYISVFSENGEQLGLSAITKNSVVDIAYSDSHAFIYVNSNNFEGKISGINDKEKEMTVDGVSYKYLQKAFDRYLMKVSYTGLFKTNRFGEIAYFELKGSNSLPGYVLNAAYVNELNEQVMLKILTASGNVEWINIYEKAKKDGETIDNKVESMLSLKEKVILYNVNKDGEITKIDSTAIGRGEDDTSLKQEMALNTDGHRWFASAKMFDRNIICSPDMIVFKVPPVTSSFRDTDSYSVVDSTALVNNKLYQAEAYKYGKTSYCNIVVLYETKYIQGTSDEIIIVTEVNEGVNESDDEVYYIEGYQKGSLITVELERPHDLLPKQGDCIRIGKDKNGKTGLIEIHYDIERNGSGMCDTEAYWYWPPVNSEPYDAINKFWNGTFRDLQADFRLGFGYPVQIDGNILKWSFNEGVDKVDELALVGDSTPIVVYDADRTKNAFYEGTIDDIKTRESYGDDCSIIVANFHWGNLTSLYVINNRNERYGN